RPGLYAGAMLSSPGRPDLVAPRDPSGDASEGGSGEDQGARSRWPGPLASSVVRRRLLIGGVAGWALVGRLLLVSSLGSKTTPQALPTASPRPSPSPPPTIPQIYAAIAPSVVFIESVHTGPNPIEETGTGVIINADGTIVTALHVVNGA